jgi:hypothetical protein
VRSRLLAGALAAGTVAAAFPACAAQRIAWNGFLQAHAAARTSDVDCPPVTECDWPAADLRGQIEAEGKNAPGNAAFLGRVDLVRDATLDETRFETRELYGDLRSEKAGARLGRQVISWGVGDLLFINDSFPRDRVALFTGLPAQYYKRGSDALKLNAYPGPANLELVVAAFRPDVVPSSRRFVLNDPLPAGLPRRTVEPDASELETSARVSGYLDNWEWAGYAAHTHYRTPAPRVSAGEIVFSYPRLNTLGASVTGAIGGGVISLEAGYYDSPQDRDGRDPSVENSQFRALVGYSRQLWQDATLGVQLYGEWMRDYEAYRDALPPGVAAKDALRRVATIRYTQLFAYQTLAFNIFAFAGLSEKDRYVIASLRYTFSDNLWTEAGANLFAGNRSGTFGALQDNRNVYLTVRLAF